MNESVILAREIHGKQIEIRLTPASKDSDLDTYKLYEDGKRKRVIKKLRESKGGVNVALDMIMAYQTEAILDRDLIWYEKPTRRNTL